MTDKSVTSDFTVNTPHHLNLPTLPENVSKWKLVIFYYFLDITILPSPSVSSKFVSSVLKFVEELNLFFISVLKWANLFCNISLLSVLKKISCCFKKRLCGIKFWVLVKTLFEQADGLGIQNLCPISMGMKQKNYLNLGFGGLKKIIFSNSPIFKISANYLPSASELQKFFYITK